MTILRRVIGLCVVGLAFVGAVAGVGYLQVQHLEDAATDLLVHGRILSNHQDADMMHDALHSDVLSLLRGRTAGEHRLAEAELNRHADQLRSDLAANSELVHDATTRAAIDSVAKQTEDYLKRAEQVSAVTGGGHPERGEPLLAEFTGSFQNLEEKLAEVSRLIADRNGRSEADAKRTATTARRILLLTALIALGVMAGIGWLVTRSIRRPLRRLQTRLEEIAEGDGDLVQRLDDSGRDELSQVAGAANAVIGRIHQLVQQVNVTARSLTVASTTLGEVADQLQADARTSVQESMAVSGAAEEVARSVRNVAAGFQQMSGAVRQVAASSNEAVRVATDAVDLGASTTDIVAKLGESSVEIAQVVDVISAVARQTNLLALNARVEAARTGALGSGFAVVANEVKQLARQTAKSTENITSRVKAIQSDTTEATAAIGDITAVIDRINDYQTMIAAAVDQHTATTEDMLRNVGNAAVGTDNIAANVDAVASAASRTMASADRVAAAATQVTHAVDVLDRQLATFRV